MEFKAFTYCFTLPQGKIRVCWFCVMALFESLAETAPTFHNVERGQYGGETPSPSLATALLLKVHCLQTSTGSKPAGGLQPCSFHSFHHELCISSFQSALKHSLPHLYCLAVAIRVAYTRNQLKLSLSLCQFSLKSIETIVTCEI